LQDASDTEVCGSSLQLNFSVSDQASVMVRSLDPGGQVLNENTLSPTVTVDEPGLYRFELEAISSNTCSSKDTVEILFNNQLKAALNIDKAECVDSVLRLFYTGEPLDNALFEWFSGNTIQESDIGKDTFEIGADEL